jgi:methyl-accepting chemotaxis protein
MEQRPEYKTLVNDVKKLRGDVDSAEKSFTNKKDQYNVLNEHVKILEEHLGLLKLNTAEIVSEKKEELKDIQEELAEVVEKIEETDPLPPAVEEKLENKLDIDNDLANKINNTINKRLQQIEKENNKMKEELWELLLQLVEKVKIVLNTPNAEYFKVLSYNRNRNWNTFFKQAAFGPKTSEFLDAYKDVNSRITQNTYYKQLQNSNIDDEKEEFEFINKLKSEIDGLYKEYTGFLGKKFGYGGTRKTKKPKRNLRKRKSRRA